MFKIDYLTFDFVNEQLSKDPIRPITDEAHGHSYLISVILRENVPAGVEMRYIYSPLARFDASNETECVPTGISDRTRVATRSPDEANTSISTGIASGMLYPMVVTGLNGFG